MAETHDPDVSGEVDEHLFPDGASVGIVEEVNLVDDHGGEVLELLAAEQHVPKNLGRHHLARCVSSDDQVARHETDLVLTMKPAVVPKFLVGERLDGRRVDDFFVGAQGLVYDVVRNQGLAGTRGAATNTLWPRLSASMASA